MLKGMGFYVLSSSVLSDGPAPMLEAHLKKHLISPDAFAMKDGKSRWVDFKAKATWTPRRINDDEPQTGMSRKALPELYRRGKHFWFSMLASFLARRRTGHANARRCRCWFQIIIIQPAGE